MRPCLSYRLHFLDVVNQNVARDKRNWYMEFLSLWCIHYQWFKDPFKLWIQSSEGPISLFGCVDCGECVEDEWFIVWMLLEISKLDPGVVIRVVDEDGEFLLIECANHLPSWINPENADNRVWLYRGEVSVICKDRKMRLQISDALSSFKNSDSTDFIVSSSIQSAIQRKIFRYPGSIKTAHLAHVTVPYTVAAVFTAFGSKQIVNSAIDILADKISDCSGLKSWLKLFNENLTIFADHCINKGGGRKPMWPKLSELSKSYLTIPIWFNKVRYAKLRSLRTPAGLVQFQSNSTASGRLAAELGLKLCVGLDLLLNHVRSHTKNSNFSPYFMVSGEAEGGWHKFMERLTNSGYFQDVLEGSWLHKELQHKAECHFLDCLSEKSCEPPAHLVYSDSDDALCTIRQIAYWTNINHESRSSIVEKVRTVEEKGIPPADDESWMYVTAEELDRMLSERDEMIEPDLPCNSISSLLKDFMNSSSSFKGIEPSKYCAGTKRKPDSKVM
ncbi:unnamed protein product [Heterobilharzia americana]|nr:unnamed protein product [Heterobilharzia americana]